MANCSVKCVTPKSKPGRISPNHPVPFNSILTSLAALFLFTTCNLYFYSASRMLSTPFPATEKNVVFGSSGKLTVSHYPSTKL